MACPVPRKLNGACVKVFHYPYFYLGSSWSSLSRCCRCRRKCQKQMSKMSKIKISGWTPLYLGMFPDPERRFPTIPISPKSHMTKNKQTIHQHLLILLPFPSLLYPIGGLLHSYLKQEHFHAFTATGLSFLFAREGVEVLLFQITM
jgi:hypothetical protein